MQPETLDPVIELRDAISFMLGAAQRMALLDEHGRIAMINPAWREAAREDSRSIAALGRGVHFLDLCDDAAAQGASDSAELAAAIRHVLARASAWALVPLALSQKRGRTATSSVSVRRVRGPLENWLLLAYSEARTDSPHPSPVPQFGLVPDSGAAQAPVRAKMHSLKSHGTRSGAAA